jgi:hypothetical protein
MNILWKILDIDGKDGAISAAKYFVRASDEQNTVETEGNWYFDAKQAINPIEQVTEQMVIDWIKSGSMVDGRNVILDRLQEQLDELSKEKTMVAPWLPQVFTLKV